MADKQGADSTKEQRRQEKKAKLKAMTPEARRAFKEARKAKRAERGKGN